MKQTRRHFLATTAAAGTGAIFSAWQPQPFNFELSTNFAITILATNWGFQGSYDDFCAKAKADGYDGIEVWLPNDAKQQKDLFNALEKYNLKFGLLAGGGASDFKAHFEQFKKNVAAATAVKPLFVNCHSGRDYFTFEQNKQMINYTTELAQKSGVKISHETHRARILFAAHVTRQFIEAIPALRLTLDISHWTNVHSSLLEDQKEAIDLALSRVDHIHSRVGHENAPQISDPRAPEWERTLNAHFAWWDEVVKQKSSANELLTMTTEFGPPSYMPTLPFTNQPVTDLWTINVSMMQLWRTRYK